LRIAVVSPFLDKAHGTERCIVEQIERFARKPDCEVHVYAQSIRDFAPVRWDGGAAPPGKIVWHRIPALPGPHLLNFVWWYFANQTLRWYQGTFRKFEYDLVFSPGINCSDARAIVAHIVFREFFLLVHSDLRFRDSPVSSWPIILHRLLYYRLIMALENRIYRDPRVSLAAVSRLTASELADHYGRQDVTVIPNAVDLARFAPPERVHRREACRKALNLGESDFVLLLVGNDWKKKGLTPLLKAVAANHELPLKLLVVGRDDLAPFLEQIRQLGLGNRVLFPSPSPDVMKFYAAADVYAGPSLHDSFALPPIEAMASGLPVITSANNGGSQIITEGVNGFVLDNPEDSAGLAEIIRRLCGSPELCRRVGESAAHTAQSYTWERNASETFDFLIKALQRKESE
jgi:UDP-glucose:(heptosyl)LPS alpha-1,3-glucosyltransferase